MHILFLSDNFPPEGNAPATRTYEHALRWVEAGHTVTVVTGAPNFPEGKVFSGYKNCWYKKENIDGINVVRVKTYITANEGFVKRILDYMSFMASGFVAGLFQRRPDVIVATSPQFFTAVGGWLLSVFKRKPFVFELRDIWPASITAVGAMKESLAIRLLEKLELFLYRRADAIVSVTHSFKQELVERGVDGKKIAVVLNGVDLEKYAPVTRKDPELAAKYGLKGKFVVGYVGTHGMAHALESVVDAAQKLKNMRDIVFLFAGGGAAREQVRAYAEKQNLGNVLFVERQPKEMMPRVWSLCDVSLANLKDSELFRTVIPSKIFESMGMGLPIIMAVPEGEATQIVEQTGSGLVVPPESPSRLADAVVKLANDNELYKTIGKNSLVAANQFSRQKLSSDMLEKLIEIGG
ncbi:glycosyltransferase family 4 protein [uncultured Ferrimonas sp.]|uniref:glycosyltransferase family 4 protein n=1 Tax=uncultured Ferrimonas sp. TaxID=432640 RepID=UPI00260D8583|nr:glycosyltransferase family 4 protein [uncultured Ferrimonas sp.]